MKKAVNIPVRAARYNSGGSERELAKANPQLASDEHVEEPTVEAGRAGDQAPLRESEGQPRAAQPEAGIDWRERALRLQAEMENYRRRQRRLAQDEIEEERSRLLQSFLRVVDDLERALAAPSLDGGGLREGILLTHRAALNLLKNEGVERLNPENEPFDPNWHDAVSTVSHRLVNATPGTVVEVIEPGYQMDGRLLRPSKVIVAV